MNSRVLLLGLGLLLVPPAVVSNTARPPEKTPPPQKTPPQKTMLSVADKSTSMQHGPEATVESLELCSLLADMGGSSARLIRLLLAAESTNVVAERFLTKMMEDSAAASAIAKIITGPAVADIIVRLGSTLTDCATLQHAADGIKHALLALDDPLAGSGVQTVLVEALTPVVKNQAPRDAVTNLLTTVSPHLLPVLIRWAWGLQDLQLHLPDELKQYQAGIEKFSSSAPLTALLGAVASSDAALDALLLHLGGGMTDAKFHQELLPKLLKTQPIFVAVADVLRDDDAATLISGVTGVVFESGVLKNSDGWALSAIRKVVRSRFLLNRIAGLIEKTPFGTDIALIWTSQDKTLVKCLEETAKLLAGATLGSASDLVDSAADKMKHAKEMATGGASDLVKQTTQEVKNAKTKATRTVAAGWNKLKSSLFAGNDDGATKDEL